MKDFAVKDFARRWRDRRLVVASNTFDPAFYLATNRDLAATGLDPLDHYLCFGGFEGRLQTLDGLPDAAYDFLIANHVLEHLEDPIAFLTRGSEALAVAAGQ